MKFYMARDGADFYGLHPEEEMRVYKKVQRQMYSADPKLAKFVDTLWAAVLGSSRVRNHRVPVAGYFVRDFGVRMNDEG